MAVLTPALLCLGSLGFLWGPKAASVGFQGRHFVTAILENRGAENPDFRLYVSPPTKGPPTAALVTTHPVGAPPFRRALRLRPGSAAYVRLPGAVELRGSRRAAGGAVRLSASRPVGVTAVNARGRASLDTMLALPRSLLGTRYVVVTRSLQPRDRHKEFAVVGGERPTRLRLTPPVPVLLDGVKHAARRPHLVHLEPFQALQVQSAGDLSGTRVMATHPVALLAGHSCLQAGDKACGHVSEQLMPLGRWGHVYAVPPFTPPGAGPRDRVYVAAGGRGNLLFWGGGAEGARALRPGDVLHFVVDQARPLVLRSSTRVQVLFLAASAARRGVTYEPFFALMTPVGAFSHSFELMAQPGFANVAVLVARVPSPVLLDQRPLPDLHWRSIPAGPEPRHGFAWTQVAYGRWRGAVHRLETRWAPIGVLSFGTAIGGAGFGTQAMGQQAADILTEEALIRVESHPLPDPYLMVPLQFPGPCKDYACSDWTTCHLVKDKPTCVPTTQATSSSKTVSVQGSEAVSVSGSETTVVAKPGPESVPEAEPVRAPVVLTAPQAGPVAGAEPRPAPVPLPKPSAMPTSTPMSKPKAVPEPDPEAVTVVTPELETVSGSKSVSVAKSETAAISRKGLGAVTMGTCWASGLPYIYTFDGHLFPTPGACTYTLSCCLQAPPGGLPAFQLWVACSGGRQSMRFVTLHVFGVTLTAVKNEFGFVRVDQQRLRLPATVSGGRLRLHFRSSELWAEAGLGQEPLTLRLIHDWQHALTLQVADSYREHVAGLCGNFNGDPADDRGGPDPRAFVCTWALQPPDAPCHALRAAPCAKPASPRETPGPCAVRTAPDGPFSRCHDVLLPTPFETSCKAWICNFPSYRPAPCMALQVYAHACQRLGISIHSWRFQAGCPMECPENSHHELCGSSCPETCAGPSGASCPLPCGETCACDPGFLRSGPACVLRRPGPGGCGCTHRGLLLAPAEALWEGAGCSLRCLCPAVAGSVLCTSASCGPGEHCVLARGLRACGPAGMATCTAAGGGHYVTFDGRRFHLPGPCAYLLSSLSTAATEALTSFRVLLGTGPNGVPSSLEVQVPGYHLQPDRKEPGRVLVNSSWQNLPFQAPGGSVLIFRQGWDTVVSCPFGLHVTYAPGIRVLLALSAAYRGRVVGLCADYNSDPTDDLRVPGTAASTKLPEDALTWAFGHSYLVVPLAGCPSVAGKMLPLPPSCATLLTTSTPAHLVQVCDILLDPLGPFRLCHRLLVPDPYFQDCVVDVCLGTGPCPVLGLYCEACQLLSSHVFPWWRPTLCSPLCPQHSHYTLCAPGCPITCAGLEEPPGCVCNAGFVLSGATCVPMAQCGCLRAGRYHKPGALLPPLHPASRCCCRCRPGGWVACKFCRPPQRPQGLRFASGESHYHTFDGTIFAYPGACTNLLVGTSPGRLRGMWPLEVVLEKDPGTPGLGPLLLHTGGHRFSLDRDDWGHITVDGVSRSLPFALSMGGARAFAQGASVALVMRGGLRLLFAPCCHLIVTLPAAFRGLTRGLCGNFNGNASDDLKPPRHAPCAALTPHPGSQCPAASKGTGGDAAWLDACGLLSKPEGPLAPCHALLPPEPFFQACVAGVGRARGKQQVLCACLQTYVAACQAAGASVLPWRAPGFCPMRCPPHSHYSSCVNPRPASCLGLQKVVHITTTCAEGCECDDGFFPAGADCVPVDRCSCFRQGQYFPPGQTILTDDCSSSCTCQPREGVTCVPFSCRTGEACGITDSVLGCRLQATSAPALSPVVTSRISPPLFTGPSPQCPAYSRFVPCGSACPATCADPSAPVHCGHPCAPTCQCLPGHLLLEGRCVSHAHCLCFLHQGSTFWTDNCTQRCQCPALGALVTGLPWCWPDTCNGHCEASAGGLQCRLLTQSSSSPITLEEPLVCTASGDFHFHTFGGAHFAFSGSSVYRLVGLCGTDHHNLEPFSLDLTPLLQSCGCTKALTLSACGLRLDMSPNDLNYIRVDSVLEWLPFSTGRCLRAYRQGRQLCVDMGFGLSLTYDWDSLVRVTLPGSYGPYLCGLCGPSGAGGPGAPLPDAWKVAEVPGCGPTCGSLCPDPCPVAARTSFAGDAHCGLVAAAAGPLGLCFEALDPQPFLHDCLDDVCRHRGSRRAVCRALAAYAVPCQALNVSLRPWRTPDFCPLRCPRHSHYELCGQCCPATCAGGERCAGGGRCCEGCACDAGFVLSGAACVPAAQCGCPRAGRYRPLGAVWYPGPRCARRCRCDSDGTVTCAPRPCGRGRVCGLRWGVRLCLPDGRASCALAGPAHLLAFGGRAFLLPAPSASWSCLDELAHTVRPGAWPFSLDVARDGAGPPSVRLSLAGLQLQLDRADVSIITVDGERCWLPWVPPGGSAWATLEGRHTVVHTTYGLRVMYDWGSQVHLTVPSAFRGWLAGLCGPFGGDTGPLDLPLDTRPWSQGPFVPRCPLPPPDHGFHVSCPPRQAQVFRAPELCGLLQAPDGPFGRCLGRISHKPFLRICLQDACHAHGRRLGLCGALTAYTAACQEAGIPVTPWRSPRLCPLTCPPRHHYSICARTCDGGCALPPSPAHCSSRCHEGCECDPGFTFDGTDCVSQDHCGCFHNRRYVPVGETLVLPGCQEYCMCLRGQDLQCQPLSCPQGTGCILDVGLWRCEAREGAMCRLVPGGLFTTFDGLSGLVPTPFIPFAYELATLVGAGSHDPNWFHVIADFLPCLGCPAPWPRMIISFKDGCVAMGPNQEIWVNGRRTRLPAQVSRGVVARWAGGSGAVIEQSPVLRVPVELKGAAALWVSPAPRGRPRTACGNYSGAAADDLTLPGGRRATSLGDLLRACGTRSFDDRWGSRLPPPTGRGRHHPAPAPQAAFAGPAPTPLRVSPQRRQAIPPATTRDSATRPCPPDSDLAWGRNAGSFRDGCNKRLMTNARGPAFSLPWGPNLQLPAPLAPRR